MRHPLLFSGRMPAVTVRMTEHRFEIGAEEAGDRVDLCLARRLPLLSKTKLRALVAGGAACRAGTPLSIGQRLHARDVVAFRWEPERVPPGFPEPGPLDVLFEDDELLAVGKPAGMLVHPTRGVKRGTLTNALLAYLNPTLDHEVTVREGGAATLWPRFVHRLDRETSGIVLAAKNGPSASALGKALSSGQFSKTYLAILGAELPEERRELRMPIARYDAAPPHWRVHPEGQTALTILKPVASAAGRTLCLLHPITGRTNQLRIHCAAIGAPILGDAAYGGASAERLMLHAWTLAVPHPTTGLRVSVRSPTPETFFRAWPTAWPTLLEDGVI